MLFRLLLAVVSVYFVIEQVETSKGRNNDTDSKQHKGKGRYQQENNCISSSKNAKKLKLREGESRNRDYPKSSKYLDKNVLTPELIDSFLAPSPINYSFETTISEQTNAYEYYLHDPLYDKGQPSLARDEKHGTNTCFHTSNQYVLPEHQYYNEETKNKGECVIDFAESRLSFQNEGEVLVGDEQKASDEKQAIVSDLTLLVGSHNFIRIEGKSSEVRRGCQRHWENFRTGFKVMTKCETCDEMLCPQCYALRHGLDTPPRDPKHPQSDQICFYCKQLLGNHSETLIQHTKICQYIPRKPFLEQEMLYACYQEKCDYQTNDRSGIRNHLRKHTGERPFECNHCKRKFSLKINRDRHIERKHKQ